MNLVAEYYIFLFLLGGHTSSRLLCDLLLTIYMMFSYVSFTKVTEYMPCTVANFVFFANTFMCIKSNQVYLHMQHCIFPDPVHFVDNYR